MTVFRPDVCRRCFFPVCRCRVRVCCRRFSGRLYYSSVYLCVRRDPCEKVVFHMIVECCHLLWRTVVRLLALQWFRAVHEFSLTHQLLRKYADFCYQLTMHRFFQRLRFHELFLLLFYLVDEECELVSSCLFLSDAGSPSLQD